MSRPNLSDPKSRFLFRFDELPIRRTFSAATRTPRTAARRQSPACLGSRLTRSTRSASRTLALSEFRPLWSTRPCPIAWTPMATQTIPTRTRPATAAITPQVVQPPRRSSVKSRRCRGRQRLRRSQRRSRRESRANSSGRSRTKTHRHRHLTETTELKTNFPYTGCTRSP
jgi:hypothetical protein